MMPLPSFYDINAVANVYVERVGLVAETATAYKRKTIYADSIHTKGRPCKGSAFINLYGKAIQNTELIWEFY